MARGQHGTKTWHRQGWICSDQVFLGQAFWSFGMLGRMRLEVGVGDLDHDAEIKSNVLPGLSSPQCCGGLAANIGNWYVCLVRLGHV